MTLHEESIAPGLMGFRLLSSGKAVAHSGSRFSPDLHPFLAELLQVCCESGGGQSYQ